MTRTSARPDWMAGWASLLDFSPPEPLPGLRTAETVTAELRQLHQRGELDLPLPGSGQTAARWATWRGLADGICASPAWRKATPMPWRSSPRPAVPRCQRPCTACGPLARGGRGQRSGARTRNGTSMAISGFVQVPGTWTELWSPRCPLTARGIFAPGGRPNGSSCPTRSRQLARPRYGRRPPAWS